MNNKDFVIESFIDYCDEMMIVNEGLGTTLAIVAGVYYAGKCVYKAGDKNISYEKKTRTIKRC